MISWRSIRRLGTTGALLYGVALGACADGQSSVVPAVPGGDPERGQELITGYACGGCHIIPGIAGAGSTTGPPLTDWAERSYIAGALYNTPDNLITWLLNPQAVEPTTAMPNMAIRPDEARDMAAYLFTIGETGSLGPPHPFPPEWLHELMPSEDAKGK
ncbi:MAG: c-type cytochrome [Gemmatimonadaceae bacterium]